MMTLIREGGFPMYVVLLLGTVMLATAFVYAVSPAASRERFLHGLCLSMLASIAFGMSAGVATTLHAATRDDAMPMELRWRIAMEGCAESLAPAILGFAFLALATLMMAAGKRRLDARRAD